MAPYTKMNMKDLLSESLYLLMLERPFDKITIKNICDKTGVIRGTFYNHFADKYETLEYLTRRLLLNTNLPTLEEKNYKKLLQLMISVFDEHHSFFTRAFQVQGQNGFEEMLRSVFCELYLDFFEDRHLDFENIQITREFLAAIQANTILFIIQDWIQNGRLQSSDHLFLTCQFILSHSMSELISLN